MCAGRLGGVGGDRARLGATGVGGARPGRTLTIRAPHIQQPLDGWRDEHQLRAGVEGTIRQVVVVTGIRRTHYRGPAKVHLEHAFSAVALNLIHLDAWWKGHPLDHTRTSHLARLELALTA